MPDSGLALPELVPGPRTMRDQATAPRTMPRTGTSPHGALSPAPPACPPPAVGALGSLLDGSCRTAQLRLVAAALHLPVTGRYVVVALAGGSPRARAAARTRWRGAGPRTLWRVAPRVDHGIVLLADGREVVAPAPAPPGVVAPGVRTGVGLPVHGLAAIAEARGRADAALALCPAAGGSVHLGEQLAAALVRSDPHLADELAARVLGPLVGGAHATAAPDTSAPDTDVLLSTFAAWVATGGSARDAAARLGCHRNTVTNRLRRLERRTGRRVDRPGDLVELVLAVQVRTLGRPR
ncbi:helix-turn-helix domain-containing protein [Isoptericola sp. NEAU-Y5]|uniref:Helix-turn-helix domain-containing protein n=1 Tax=Isoptericola luteus TaxID=2879484 RepID=A0ABS7ZIK2_9MICO|nr:helix-turn-helix domain-containing protein [Isoptericola sp. NEAU-Y5]MCA5893644.1 helix-turn-helix domain-containing protein [Isoptericola sp. NEAU-Y5]